MIPYPELCAALTRYQERRRGGQAGMPSLTDDSAERTEYSPVGAGADADLQIGRAHV